jgi:uncharacterized cupredoxin-like copper-binding protein
LKVDKFFKIPIVFLLVGIVSDPRSAAAFFHSRVQTVEVVLAASEFYFNPSRVTVPAGKVKFIIMNLGNYTHGLAFAGGGISQRISRVNPTRSATLTVRFAESGEVIFYCPLKGHRKRGQEGIAFVTSADVTEGKGS